MKALGIIVGLLLALALCYLFVLLPRRGERKLEALRKYRYAHRGLHGEGRPENSMAAFRAALENGYGIELDIHLLKDGNLAVIHDSSLLRTAGADVMIEDLNTEDLCKYHLEGTAETIPTFREVLDLFAGKAPLIIELKAANNNHAALSQTACRTMEGYEGPYCMESFDPRCVHWLKKNRPEITRGQLTENFFSKKGGLSPVIKFLLTHNLLNFLTRPDFVAYKYADRKDTFTNAIWRKLWKLQAVSWTLKSQKEYDTAAEEGWLPIFEGFRP